MAQHPVFSRKLRMGMVGGGPGSFIGGVHLKAARMDGQIELVAGAFSSDPEKSKVTGAEQYLDPSRVYGSYKEMVARESKLPEDQRIDFVSITTPNHMHFAIARDFLKAGFHVVSDKVMALTVKEALALRQVIKKSGKVYALTQNYTGYPMVKLARDIVRRGDLGTLRKIAVQYPQGWLHTALEKQGAKQAMWRTDPRYCGAAGCMGDLASHGQHMAEYITGLRIVEICADLTAFVPGRKLDDDGNCLVHWEKGVKGFIFASQISIGEENGLAIWVYGDKGAIEWHQEHPNYLYVKKPEAPVETWRRGNGYIGQVSPAAARATRLPFGHPEAYFEAFANVYVNIAAVIRAAIAGTKPDPLALDVATADEGVRGMQFIEAVVKSSKKGAVWVKMPKQEKSSQPRRGKSENGSIKVKAPTTRRGGNGFV